jgi:hypothetical protein
MCKSRFPHSELELVQKIGHQHIVEVEAKFGKTFGEGILKLNGSGKRGSVHPMMTYTSRHP